MKLIEPNTECGAKEATLKVKEYDESSARRRLETASDEFLGVLMDTLYITRVTLSKNVTNASNKKMGMREVLFYEKYQDAAGVNPMLPENDFVLSLTADQSSVYNDDYHNFNSPCCIDGLYETDSIGKLCLTKNNDDSPKLDIILVSMKPPQAVTLYNALNEKDIYPDRLEVSVSSWRCSCKQPIVSIDKSYS